MKFVIVPVTAFEQNCSILVCESTGRAAIVDPGGDPDRIEGKLAQLGAEPEKILLTHAHIDHAGATAELSEKLDLPIEGPHKGDKFWIDALPQQGTMFGLPTARVFTPDRWLVDGDTVTFGQVTMQVLHCPGHTPGHVVFVSENDRLAVVGDVLFSGSIGRKDFPGGEYQTLIRSIREKLFPLGDEFRFIPGHGPMSTLGDERRSNPFVSDRAVG